MTDIQNFINEADKKSKFLKLIEGEPVIATFKGASMIDDTFNPGKKTMEYRVEVDEVEKSFKSGSTSLARQFAGIKSGDKVKIVKTGNAFTTKWYVTKEA